MDRATHLYRYFDAADRLLYIGVSSSAIRRLLEHADGKAWAVLVSRVEVATLPTRAEALKTEAAAIRKEKPLYNVQHNKPTTGKNTSTTSRTKMLATRVPLALLDDLAAVYGPGGPAQTQSEAVVLVLRLGILALTNSKP